MKNTMKILSRVVLIAAFGILFSFMAGTEVKAVDSCQVCLYVDPSEGGTTNPEPSFPTSMKPYNYSPGEEISITAIPNNGYIFRRWSATGGGTFADEYNASTIFNVPDIYASGVTAYFATAPTITFDANGGSVTQTSAQVGTNRKLASLPTATWTGHNCIGWFTQATGGVEVTENTEFTTNTTIYAHWQNATPPSITTTTLPNGTVGEAYSQQLEASGGSGSLNWEIISNDLAGLQINSSGMLSVTPDSAGEYHFTVKVTDTLNINNYATKSFTIIIDSAAVTHTVTYHVLNGKWNDDSTADRTETVANGQYPREIPHVGSKPNSGYKAGSWDTNPSSVTITGNSNFTYTYVSDTPSSSSKKSDDSDHYESSPAPAPKPVNPNAIISTSFSFKGAAVNSSFGKGVIKIGPQEQGMAAQLAFRLNTPAGWREAFSFNMTVNNETTYDPKKGTLSFTIPTRYQKDGRKFAILGIDQDGKVKIFYDKDATADTITVHLIDFPGYAFDLIYVD